MSIDPSDDRTVISCTGHLDFATSVRLRVAFEEAVRASPAQIQLDLRELDFLDSAGVRSLAYAQRMCGERGIGFEVSLSKQAQRVIGTLDLSGLPGDDRPGQRPTGSGSTTSDEMA